MAAALLLAGCASTGYKCPKPYACNPVHHNYRAAVTDTKWSGWQAGHAARTPTHAGGGYSHDDTAAAATGNAAQVAGLVNPSGDVLQGPVYTPPQPWRVWLAPMSRDDGTLESGTYIWFVTPGHWTYLGKRWKAPPLSASHDDEGGALGGSLGPVPPDALGFTPGRALAPQGVLDNIQQPQPSGGN